MAGRTPATLSRPGREAGNLARIVGAPYGTSILGQSQRLRLPEWQLSDGSLFPYDRGEGRPSTQLSRSGRVSRTAPAGTGWEVVFADRTRRCVLILPRVVLLRQRRQLLICRVTELQLSDPRVFFAIAQW